MKSTEFTSVPPEIVVSEVFIKKAVLVFYPSDAGEDSSLLSSLDSYPFIEKVSVTVPESVDVFI